MPLISYAQNAEDVLLWRALRDVGNGFYIDVGANDPELHSVTKLFYDAGWNGINVEPMPSYAAAFAEQRPRDLNLNCALGSAAGSITLHEVEDMNGWATTDPAVADEHRAHGHVIRAVSVPLRTLAEVCAEHVHGPVHFLKIDVEGFEGEVLKGMDLTRWRPWVLVIEATRPGSTETCHAEWEHLVLPFDYQFAWFDGLNRYYVAAEHAELAPRLALQPNVFDDYQSHHLDKALRRADAEARQVRAHWERIETLDASLGEAQQRLADTHAQYQTQLADAHARHQAALAESEARRAAEAAAARAHIGQLEGELHSAAGRAEAAQRRLLQADEWGRNLEQRLNAVYASTSWKLTRPLRFLAKRGPGGPLDLARRAPRVLLRRAVRWVTARESLRRLLLPLMARSPLAARLLRGALDAAKQASAATRPHAPDVPAALRELSPATRSVLADLRAAYASPDAGSDSSSPRN